MRARALCAAILAALAVAALPAPASAAFGINSFDVTFTNADGTTATQAGSHPFAMTTTLGANTDAEGRPDGRLKDFVFEQIAGLAGDTTAYERCTTLEFLEKDEATGTNACRIETAVGIAASATSEPGLWSTAPLFNLEPPPGVLLRLGFKAGGAENIVIDVSLSQTPPYKPVAAVRNTPEIVDVYGSKVQLWGDPSDSRHDELRGSCGFYVTKLPPGDIAGFQFEGQGESCHVSSRPRPLLTLPTTCSEPLLSSYEAISWAGQVDRGSRLTHDPAGNPIPFAECGGLSAFAPHLSTSPTTRAASSPTGLDISLGVDDSGLVTVGGRAQSDIRKVVLKLPEGMTANPAVAEGLEVCTQADLARESLGSAPGQGCPQASKLGSVEVDSPLIDKTISGALYQAAPYENPFGTLLAFYFVLKDPELGIIVKQAAKVIPDPDTGQLEGITEDIPQLPFSSFRLRFREGARSPLVSPPSCGPHTATAEITPWSGGPEAHVSSTFELIAGHDSTPCPTGPAPFDPGFQAGSESNAAGHHSPFSMRLTRRDGDQDLTRFDATLPPGVAATLAGVSQCTDAQIARAKQKSGRSELASPSCPANSQIGTTRAGAGVGSQLTYVSGSLYLAGPFGGAPLSAVAIVPAVAGPFDVGTVVVREALQVNPRTGVVSADGAHSDPIPHILAGIPLVVRDVQVDVDRPGFTLNPTSCNRLRTDASIWGGGENPFSTVDNAPVFRSARYQASSCASLGFAPRLWLKLRGGTRRGAFPALRAVLRPRAGNANIKRAVVRLPHSAFLEQGHFRTICTRVQYAASACPKAAIYGRVRAFTPLLAQPLEGPVYLRSSNHNLPDLVFDLHGLIDIEAVGRIDSKKGGIRTTFAGIPDAPITKVVLNMQGGRKGLIVNSTDICRGKHRANTRLLAHNSKRRTIKPLVRATCAKKRRHAGHRRR